MSVRITWQPSSDADIASYDLETGLSVGGPWTLLANVVHAIPGAAWDEVNSVFFYEDGTSSDSSYYRLTAIDALSQRSVPSNPFRASGAPPAAVPGLVNQVTVQTGNASALLDLGYRAIEIWESTDLGASFHEITANAAAPAQVSSSPVPIGGLRVGGETLTVSLNGSAERAVFFSDIIHAYSATQIVAQINQAIPNLASLVGDRVVLSTEAAGRAASLEVLTGVTGLFSLSISYGRDQRVLLVDGVQFYAYYDVAGSLNSRYRWRFSNNGAAPFSKFSPSTPGLDLPLTGAPLSMGTLRFLRPDGRPSKGSILVSVVAPAAVSGYLVSSDTTDVFRSDDTGLLEVPFVIGSRVRVAIEGTSLVREFLVPNTPTFDILQALCEAPDMFSVQTMPPLLSRRSLP